MTNITDIAYFAGLIDGEGSIRLAKRSDRPSLKPTLKVNMTHKGVIESLQVAFGGSVTFRPAAKAGWKDQWVWRCHNRQAITALEAMLPFFKVKLADALSVIDYGNTPRKKGRVPK